MFKGQVCVCPMYVCLCVCLCVCVCVLGCECTFASNIQTTLQGLPGPLEELNQLQRIQLYGYSYTPCYHTTPSVQTKGQHIKKLYQPIKKLHGSRANQTCPWTG